VSYSVLIVDDEPEFLQVLIKRLRHRAIEVSGVDRGDKALRLMAVEPKDVVVLDLRMPGIGGMETLRRIKANNPDTEVILLTGHAKIEVAKEGLQAGAFDYVMKPVVLDELVHKIEDAAKHKSLKGGAPMAQKE
jgi:DNA-binding NtrC family response regulator